MTPASGEAIAAAYQRCEAITRARAGNFYYGIRLLPAHKRRAISAVYAFARRVDDIGDGSLEPPRKLELLAHEERALAALAGGQPGESIGVEASAAGPASHASRGERPPDAVMIALADANRRFALPLPALGELIAGVRMDVRGASYERFDELVLYCRRVAGTIGRLCVAIFGAGAEAESTRADALADDLGVALQLTNILRDLREDAQQGRVYVPGEDLRRFALPPDAAQASALLARAGDLGARPETEASGLDALVRFEAARAREWFARGLELAPLLDRRSSACVLAMSGIYRRVLGRIEADPRRALAARTALPGWEKAWVALTSVRSARPRSGRARAPSGAVQGSG